MLVRTVQQYLINYTCVKNYYCRSVITYIICTPHLQVFTRLLYGAKGITYKGLTQQL